MLVLCASACVRHVTPPFLECVCGTHDTVIGFEPGGGHYGAYYLGISGMRLTLLAPGARGRGVEGAPTVAEWLMLVAVLLPATMSEWILQCRFHLLSMTSGNQFLLDVVFFFVTPKAWKEFSQGLSECNERNPW